MFSGVRQRMACIFIVMFSIIARLSLEKIEDIRDDFKIYLKNKIFTYQVVKP